MSPLSAQLVQIGFGFLLAVLLSRSVIKLKIHDLPDGNRKMQKVPVPSAGGLAIAGAAIVAWVATLVGLDVESLLYETREIIVVALAGLILGLIDDMGFIGTKLKFLVLALVALMAASSLYIIFPYWFVEHPLAGTPTKFRGPLGVPSFTILFGSALWVFVVMNSVNFMDGSNGLMTGSVAIMMLGIIILSIHFVGPTGLARTPYLAVIAATGGFLIWNLRGALYAGDTGALFLGGLFAASSLAIARDGYVSVFTPATFALPFLIDVLLTLLWRVRRGRDLLSAHREHAYQLFVRAGWSHWHVALLWWGGTLACVLAGVAAFMARGPFPAIAFFMGTALGAFSWYIQRQYYAPRLGL